MTIHLCREEPESFAPSTFPELPSHSYRPQATESLSSWIPRVQSEQENENSIPITSILQLAWALVIAAYTDSNDVVFGLGIEASTAKVAVVCPFRVKVQPEHVVAEALTSLNTHGHAVSPACRFQNVLIIRHSLQGPLKTCTTTTSPDSSSDTCPLSLTVEIQEKGLHVYAQVDPGVISPTMGQMVLDQLVHVAGSIQSNPTDRLKSLLGICSKGLEQVHSWNARLQPSRKELCILDVIANRCQEHPLAPAVCAWDGSLTYSELDAQSTNLANRLFTVSREPERFVGLFLEKSMWTAVCMLGVMKAGNAFVLLDPSLPDQRLETLCRISHAAMILTSPGQFARASRLGPPVMIAQDDVRAPIPASSFPLPVVNPYQAAYAAFTSGSSGEPKGVVVDHVAVCSGVDAYCASVALNNQSRVLQFASYSFTISVVDHLIALMQGACLCVPSVDQLKNTLLDTMLSFNVNWVTITPSVARVLDPESIPGLKTLCLAGETLTSSDLEKWQGQVDLKSIYGQSENTLAALVDTKKPLSNPYGLGYAFAANCWIVHPRDSHRLVPIGAEGELWLDAPTMARGYLNDEEQTRATFIHDPVWWQNARPGERGRFVKTGDIVRYQPEDGSIQYVGRIGTQVKLRGQRIELAEVEFQLRRQFPAVEAVVAEIVTFGEAGTNDDILVAFIATGNRRGHDENAHDSPLFANTTSAFAQQSQQTSFQLREVLPEYMIPTTFVPLSTLPLTPSGKLNRRLLRNKAAGLGNKLHRYHVLSKKAHRQGVTESEATVQRICASILRLSPMDINMDDTFFELGGNSISTMQLVSQARDAGLSFTASDVFQQVSLAALVQDQGKSVSQKQRAVSPGEFPSVISLREKLVHQNPTSIDIEKVSDIFPCTEMQQWMLNNHEGGYFLLRFSGPLDPGKLEAACQRLVETHTALRSIFVPLDETLFQVILNEIDLPFTVHAGTPAQDPILVARNLCSVDGENPFPLGLPPLRFTLVTDHGEQHALIIRLSHAQYDGICQQSIVSDLCTFYQEPADPGMPTDFALYTRQVALRQTSEAFAFWRSLLDGSTITRLPYTLSQTGTKDSILRCSTEIAVRMPPSGITMASVVKAAWSSVLREATGDHDLVFGQLVNMRSMDMPGIYRLVGPCYGVIPVRLKYQLLRTVLDLLCAVQNQHAQCIPFETTEWDRIVSQSTNWPPGTRPQSLVVHQNFSTEMDLQTDGLRCQLADYIPIEPTDMSLDLYSEPQGDRLTLTLLSSSQFIAKRDMHMLLEKLCRTVVHFLTAPESALEL